LHPHDRPVLKHKHRRLCRTGAEDRTKKVAGIAVSKPNRIVHVSGQDGSSAPRARVSGPGPGIGYHSRAETAIHEQPIRAAKGEEMCMIDRFYISETASFDAHQCQEPEIFLNQTLSDIFFRTALNARLVMRSNRCRRYFTC